MKSVSPNSLKHKSAIFFSLGFLLLVMIITLGFALNEAKKKSQASLLAAALERAQYRVLRNSDWQPYQHLMDGLKLVLVPAGCFMMGTSEQQLAEAADACERFFGTGKCQVDFKKVETPAHKVCFDQPFWISEIEVTNRQYGSSSSTDLINMFRAPDWPRETVTWQEASDFCTKRNARLPSEAEWEYAARGPDNLIYPWGNEFDPQNLSSGRLSPSEVGSIPAGVSWVGAFDMSGNIAEWVADWYAPYIPEPATYPKGPDHGDQRIIRGGSWFSFSAYAVRTSQRDPASPDTANSTIGFRCAR